MAELSDIDIDIDKDTNTNTIMNTNTSESGEMMSPPNTDPSGTMISQQFLNDYTKEERDTKIQSLSSEISNKQGRIKELESKITSYESVLSNTTNRRLITKYGDIISKAEAKIEVLDKKVMTLRTKYTKLILTDNSNTEQMSMEMDDGEEVQQNGLLPIKGVVNNTLANINTHVNLLRTTGVESIDQSMMKTNLNGITNALSSITGLIDEHSKMLIGDYFYKHSLAEEIMELYKSKYETETTMIGDTDIDDEENKGLSDRDAITERKAYYTSQQIFGRNRFVNWIQIIYFIIALFFIGFYLRGTENSIYTQIIVICVLLFFPYALYYFIMPFMYKTNVHLQKHNIMKDVYVDDT